MAEENEIQEAKKGRSAHFYIPHISYFTEGNPYIGSNNTFNFRLAPKDDEIKSFVWYGMKCFELSECVNESSAPKDDDGLTVLAQFVDKEYEAYLMKTADGTVKSRRTYRETEKK